MVHHRRRHPLSLPGRKWSISVVYASQKREEREKEERTQQCPPCDSPVFSDADSAYLWILLQAVRGL